jgi:hypothetical protein
MDAARFRALLSAYGANPRRWPERERSSAERLVADSEDAREWLLQAERVDTMLERVTPVEPSSQLMRRVAEIPLRSQSASEGQSSWTDWGMRRLVAIGIGAAVLGLAAGSLVRARVLSRATQESWNELPEVALIGDIPEEMTP